MARSINKVIILGNVGSDPEVRTTTNGRKVATLSVATNHRYTRDGQQHEETEWHRVVLWERLAEVAGQFVRKGSAVYVEGRLRTRKWQDQSGQERTSVEIIAREFVILGSPNANDTQAAQSASMPQANQVPASPFQLAQAPSYGYAAPAAAPQLAGVGAGAPSNPFQSDDDLPF